MPKKNVSFYQNQKRLVCTLDCYNVEFNRDTLTDLQWSSFRQQVTVGSQFL